MPESSDKNSWQFIFLKYKENNKNPYHAYNKIFLYVIVKKLLDSINRQK